MAATDNIIVHIHDSDQSIGPFATEDAAKDWIEDQWGEYPTEDAEVIHGQLPADHLDP